jgi:hypothetical protein
MFSPAFCRAISGTVFSLVRVFWRLSFEIDRSQRLLCASCCCVERWLLSCYHRLRHLRCRRICPQRLHEHNTSSNRPYFLPASWCRVEYDVEVKVSPYVQHHLVSVPPDASNALTFDEISANGGFLPRVHSFKIPLMLRNYSLGGPLMARSERCCLKGLSGMYPAAIFLCDDLSGFPKLASMRNRAHVEDL